MRGSAVWGIIRTTAKAESHMAKPPDRSHENIDFAAQELLEAPVDQRPVLLENIAKALTSGGSASAAQPSDSTDRLLKNGLVVGPIGLRQPIARWARQPFPAIHD